MNPILHSSEGPAEPAIPSAPGVAATSELAPASEEPDARVILVSDGRMIGHVGLWWTDTPEWEGRRIGTVGGFLAPDEASAGLLLDAAAARLRDAGCELAVGPMNGNTWRRHRFITWSNGRGSYLMEPRHPEEYPRWWQSAGFKPLSNYSSSAVPLDGESTVPPALEARLARRGIHIRPLDPTRYENELRAIHAISVRSFQDNFLYTPLDETEFVAAYVKFRERIDPDLVRIAERDGTPCGFVFAVADLEAAARGEAPALIVKTLAVDPGSRCAGLGSLLVDQVHATARTKGFTEAIHATQHESNSSRRITGRHAGEPFRRYTLFFETTMNLVSLLAERAAKHPERPALIDRKSGRDRIISFAELHRRVGSGAGFLARLGLVPGDTLLVFQPVSIELYEVLLAAFHGGIQVMLADPANGAAFLRQCCERIPPAAFFGPWKAQALRVAIPALRRIPRAIRSNGWFPGARRWDVSGTAASIHATSSGTPALITFTSGSTGKPKAAVRSHGFLLAQHRVLAESLDFKEAEVDLITLPVFVLANLASGLTSVLADTDLRTPGEADGTTISRQCTSHGVTRCSASPAFFEALLRRPDAIPSFSKVFTGGAPVFPDLLHRLTEALPNGDVTAIFGSTEAEPMAHLPADHYDASRLAMTAAGAGLCTGQPVEGIDLRIMENRWGNPVGNIGGLILPCERVGEIIVRGEHVLPGYLDGVGDSETKIRTEDGVWHRTGDAGWIDRDGHLWLLGRCSAELPAGPAPGSPPGAFDYPFAIECALRAIQPGFRTADSRMGWQAHDRDRRSTAGRRTVADKRPGSFSGNGVHPSGRTPATRSAATMQRLIIPLCTHFSDLPLLSPGLA